MKDFLKSTNLTFALFGVYLIALFWIIVLKFNIGAYYRGIDNNYNLIPYSALFQNGKVDFGEIILNIMIFVPFGLYVGVLFEKWSIAKTVALFLFTSFLMEVSQYLLGVGAFDSTDLINNTLGGIIGLVIYIGLKIAFKSRLKAQKSINIVALSGTIIIFSFLLFLKINDLWIFRMNTIKTLSDL